MSEFFVGRQPIFDRDNDLFGYELLYRHSLENEAGNVNRTVQTSRVVVNTFVDIGLENLVGNHTALLNVTDEFLQAPEVIGSASHQVVLALPPSTTSSSETTTILDRLKSEGYRIALNGYRSHLPVAGLLPYADIAMIDALDATTAELAAEIESLEGLDLVRLAKRVETTVWRNELADIGFECFQGNFIARPQIVTGAGVPTNRVAILDLVTKISNPDTTSEELETLIAMDPALAMRVLRFVNSPLSGLSTTIESIHHAVVMLGRDMIKNWVMLLAISSLDDCIPSLLNAAFTRAKFCESLATAAGHTGKESFFTVGLFSLMDAIMKTSMVDLVETLPFTSEIKSALTDEVGPRGEAVRCARRLEQGRAENCTFPGVTASQVAWLHLGAVQWADQQTAAAGTATSRPTGRQPQPAR